MRAKKLDKSCEVIAAVLSGHGVRSEEFGLRHDQWTIEAFGEPGGVPEVIRQDVNGILVPPGDPAAIAAALRRLADDPDLGAGLGARARETVAEELNIVGTAAAYAHLYQELA